MLNKREFVNVFLFAQIRVLLNSLRIFLLFKFVGFKYNGICNYIFYDLQYILGTARAASYPHVSTKRLD